MIIEGVNFNEAQIRGMKRDAFIAMHSSILWLDRTREVREKMLGETYDRIVPDKPRKKKE